MKTKSFLLTSILSLKDEDSEQNARIKELLLQIAEEVGAWLLVGGFLLGISWAAEILLGAQ